VSRFSEPRAVVHSSPLSADGVAAIACEAARIARDDTAAPSDVVPLGKRVAHDGQDAVRKGLPTGRPLPRFDEPSRDQLALGLKVALDCILPAMARVAEKLVPLRAWVPFGFARMDDFARERLGRTGRWLRNLRALGDALSRSSSLADALAGRDGNPPIGQVAALAIAGIASERSTGAWINLARRLPIRRFKQEVRRACQADSDWPLAPPHAVERSRQAEELTRVHLAMPRTVRAAFDETLQLHRAVCGAESSTSSFVQDLVGEAYAGPHPPDPDVFRLPMVRDQDLLEAILFHNSRQWSHLGYRPRNQQAVEQLWQAAELLKMAGKGGPREWCLQLQKLIALEDRLQKELGRVLALIGHQRGWSKLDFAGLGHYAEQRLGISRTTAQDRVRLYRVLHRYPLLRKAYESGTIGLEATLLAVRSFRGRAVAHEVERRWVERAAQATVKRLRDEVRVVVRDRVPRGPLTDEEWYASLRRAPGDSRERVKKLGLEATDRWMTTETLGLSLTGDLAAEFFAAVEGWKEALGRGEGPEGWVVTQVARTFSGQGRPLPRWVGLLAMLEDFVETWDDPQAMPRRKADRIYVRDGWRCAAPACSSRKNLESHHLTYRSHGGELKSEENQVTLCRFHHQLGEHGSFARCSGTAPLGIVWRLGKEGTATEYKNEIVRVSDAGP